MRTVFALANGQSILAAVIPTLTDKPTLVFALGIIPHSTLGGDAILVEVVVGLLGEPKIPITGHGFPRQKFVLPFAFLKRKFGSELNTNLFSASLTPMKRIFTKF